MAVYPRQNKLRDNQMMGAGEFLETHARILFIHGAIGMEHNLAYYVCNNLLALSKQSKDPITLFITSPGGIVHDAMTIYDTLRLVDVPIITVSSFCASAAVPLFAMGNERYLLPNAKMMLHLPSAVLQGDSTDLAIQQALVENVKDKIITTLIECGAKKTGVEILKDIDREYWMTAEEAIDYGLADKILDKKALRKILGAPLVE